MKKYIIITFLLINILIPIKTYAATDPKQTAVEKALNYLSTKQKTDGSMENAGLTDWTTMAIVAAGYDPSTFKSFNQSIIDYQIKTFIPKEPISSELSRHILALTAANIAREDYLNQLITQYHDSQCGDLNYINDDMFCLLALDANYIDEYQPYIDQSAQYILNHQGIDGGFSWDITSVSDSNMTASAIESLVYTKKYLPLQVETINTALKKAKDFLKLSQNNDGGFGYFSASDSDSTSWIIEAIISLDEDPSEWIKNNRTPYDYLLSMQAEEGSFYWQDEMSFGDSTTANAILALSGKPLPIIQNENPKSFIKETPPIAVTPTPIPTPIPTSTPTPLPSQNNSVVNKPKIQKHTINNTLSYQDDKPSSTEITTDPSTVDLTPTQPPQKENKYIPPKKPEVKGAKTSNKKPIYLVLTLIFSILVIIQISKILKQSKTN